MASDDTILHTIVFDIIRPLAREELIPVTAFIRFAIFTFYHGPPKVNK